MNLVVICDGAGVTGGAEKVAISSAVGLAQRGLRVGFFGGEGPAAQALAEAGIETVCLDQADFHRSTNKLDSLRRFFWNQHAADELGRFLDRFDPADTLVHVHSFRRVLSASVIEVIAKRGFRRLMTLHDFGVICPNTTFYNSPKREICRLRPFGAACWCSQCTHSGLKMKVGQMARARVLEKVGVRGLIRDYISVSQFALDVMKPYLGDARATVVHNPADVVQAEPANVAGNEAFVWMGRMTPEKDPTFFAEATNGLGVTAKLAGDGPEKDRAIAANPQMEYLGWLRGPQVTGLLAQARALVMTSRWYETAGLVVIDAVAAGVPVIVPNTCAATEFVRDGQTGLIYQGGNLADLRAKISQLRDPGFAARLGRQAYEEFWRDPLSLEKHVNRLLPIYEGVLYRP